MLAAGRTGQESRWGFGPSAGAAVTQRVPWLQVVIPCELHLETVARPSGEAEPCCETMLTGGMVHLIRGEKEDLISS